VAVDPGQPNPETLKPCDVLRDDGINDGGHIIELVLPVVEMECD
jgi:hypothetical protein